MEQEIYKGIPVTLYYNPDYRKCAGGGVTEKDEEFILIGSDVLHEKSPFEETDPEKILVLKSKEVGTEYRSDLYGQKVMVKKKHYYAVPLLIVQKGLHSMMGGSFVHTSDSRVPVSFAIPVHDRVES